MFFIPLMFILKKCTKFTPSVLEKYTKTPLARPKILSAEQLVYHHSLASRVVSSAMVLPPGTVLSPLSTVSGTR